MTHTRPWRSKRHLRRTYSLKHTGLTVSTVTDNDLKKRPNCQISQCGIFSFVFRWDCFTWRPHCCLQEQHRPFFLCHWKLSWKWGEFNIWIFVSVFGQTWKHLVVVINWQFVCYLCAMYLAQFEYTVYFFKCIMLSDIPFVCLLCLWHLGLQWTVSKTGA